MTDLDPASPGSTNPSYDFLRERSLARRMSRRATDFIAITVVAVGILAVSGRLAEWWSTSPGDVLHPDQSVAEVAGNQGAWGAGESSVALRLGQLPLVMHRQVIVGDEDRALSASIQTCLELLERTRRDPFLALTATDAEAAVLTQLRGIQPIKESPGRWRIYRIDQPGSFVVGTLLIGVHTLGAESSVTGRSDSLACWSIAVPNGSVQWTVFAFEKSKSPTGVAVNVPIPPDSRVVLTVSDQHGGQLGAFESVGGKLMHQDLARWVSFFDCELPPHGWRLVRAWAPTSAGTTARFEMIGMACELQIQEAAGVLSGLVNTIPLQTDHR